jgi:hypothetical protein
MLLKDNIQTGKPAYVQAMKAGRRIRGIATLIFNLGATRELVVSFMPSSFTNGDKDPCTH